MEDNVKKRMMLFAGNSNPELGREIANYLGMGLGKMDLSYFSNGEIYVRYLESVRGADAFVIQSLSPPVNTHLMELLIMIDALKRASAKRISAVIPHYGYSRQDHKAEPREPITARLVADLLTAAGAKRVLTMDLHSGQIQGFFSFPLDHLTAIPLLANYFLEREIKDLVVVSPDVGRVKTAKKFADRLHGELAILHKSRPGRNVAQVMQVVGAVKGKNAIMIDDMIDTGGTLVEGLAALKTAGAKDVYACATHPIFSASAVERLSASELKEIVVTNTITIPPEKQTDKFVVLSIAPVFAQIIKNVYEEESVSELFEGDNQM